MKPIATAALLSLMAVILASGCVTEAPPADLETTGVMRTFSSATVSPGERLTVKLDVVAAGGEDHYAIEEYAPKGFTVKRGETTVDNRQTFYVLQNPENKSYRYDAVAPQQPGTYEFLGFYMFQGMDESVNITGQSTVTVTG